MFITHDLGVIAGFAQQVLVMYAGAAVEQGPVDELFAEPSHPYTQALMAAVPRVDDRRAELLRTIPGTLPPAGVRAAPAAASSRAASWAAGASAARRSGPGSCPSARAACHFADEARRGRRT